MAEPSLNFSTDIAPIRNSFGLTSSEASFTNRVADEAMAPQLDMMLKLRSQLTRERNADLAYETGLFDLQQKKKEEEDKIEFAQKSERLMQPLEEIMNDPFEDPYEQMQELQRLAMENNQILQKSPQAKQLFDSATKSLQAKLNQQNQKYARDSEKRAEQRLIDREQDPTSLLLTEARGIRTAEDLTAFKEKLLDGGSTDKEEALLGIGAQSVEAKKELRAKETREQNLAQATARQRRADNLLKIDQDYLDDLSAQLKAVASDMADIEGDDPDALSRRQSLLDQFQGYELPDGSTLTGVSNVGDVSRAIAEQRKKLRDNYNANLGTTSSRRRVGGGFNR